MAVTLTRAGVSLATAGLGLLGLGMAMGNVELLVLATFPLLLLAAPLAARADRRVGGMRLLSTRTPRRGDPVDVELRLRVPEGVELAEAHAGVPAGFSLDQGTNLLLHTQPGAHVARFRLRAHARGQHALPPVTVETLDPHGLLAARTMQVAPAESLEVTPRAFHSDRVRRRGVRKARNPLPDLEHARLGAGSSDFRELREYAWGDPPKSINWKATARRLSSQAGRAQTATVPLVNEYEKEGRRTVLVLLDGGADLRVGTTLETGLDHAVEAAVSAARLFLDRGARVGAATFHAASPGICAPEAGGANAMSLERALAPGAPDPALTPQRVLRDFDRHLAGGHPVLFVVTRLTPRNSTAIADIARRMRVLLHERRRTVLVYVVDVRALALAPPAGPAWETARELVEREDEEAAREVVEAGARVIPWRPGQEDLRAALLRRGLA